MILPVLAAIIRDPQDRLLIAKRKPQLTRGGHWEFPGGKLKSGESPETGIVREINEELGMSISVESIAGVVTHKYPDIEILLIAYFCLGEAHSGEPVDHDEVRWVDINDLENFSFSEADRKLIAHLYQ